MGDTTTVWTLPRFVVTQTIHPGKVLGGIYENPPSTSTLPVRQARRMAGSGACRAIRATKSARSRRRSDICGVRGRGQNRRLSSLDVPISAS
jgi:hypothetical protein